MIRPLLTVVAVLVVALLVGGAGLGASLLQSKEYAATALLRYNTPRSDLIVLEADVSQGGANDDRRLASNAAEAGSTDNVAATAAAADREVEFVSDQVEVAGRRDSDIVEITGRDASRGRASALANIYARTALARARLVEARRARLARDALTTQIAALSVRGAPELDSVAQLRQNSARLLVLEEAGSGSPALVQTARPDQAETSPDLVRNVAFSLLFGLVLGVALVTYVGRGRP